LFTSGCTKPVLLKKCREKNLLQAGPKAKRPQRGERLAAVEESFASTNESDPKEKRLETADP